MLPNHYHGYGYPFQPRISATVFYPCQIYIFLSFALNLDIHLVPCKVFNCVLGNWTDLLHYIHYNNWPYRYKNQLLHPFNGPFSGTTWVSRHQKGKTNLDFTEARDSEWQWHQLGHMQVCTKQITMPAPHHSVFYRPDALPAAQPTVSKHWRHKKVQKKVQKSTILNKYKSTSSWSENASNQVNTQTQTYKLKT